MTEDANTAFEAWAVGEHGGDYTAFKSLLSPNFRLYSHPMSPERGVHTDGRALEAMLTLIKGREQTPNYLHFTNVIRTQGKTTASGETTHVFLFDSVGKVAGGFPYQGYNAITLIVQARRIVGFREYFGDVEPAWFRPRDSQQS